MENQKWDPIAAATQLLDDNYALLNNDAEKMAQRGLIAVDHILQRNGVPRLVRRIAQTVSELPRRERYFETAFFADLIERVSYSIATALDRSTETGGYQIPLAQDMRTISIAGVDVLCRLSRDGGAVRFSAASEAGILIVERDLVRGESTFGKGALLYAEFDPALHAYRSIFYTPQTDSYARVVGQDGIIEGAFKKPDQVISSFEQILPITYPPGFLTVLR